MPGQSSRSSSLGTERSVATTPRTCSSLPSRPDRCSAYPAHSDHDTVVTSVPRQSKMTAPKLMTAVHHLAPQPSRQAMLIAQVDPPRCEPVLPRWPCVASRSRGSSRQQRHQEVTRASEPRRQSSLGGGAVQAHIEGACNIGGGAQAGTKG